MATLDATHAPPGPRRAAEPPRPRRRLPSPGTAALILLGLAFATMVQSFSWNQSSHYDLIRAIAHGTAHIDAYIANTGDKAFYAGHWYSARAPGLAFWEMPFYGLLTLIGFPHFGATHMAQPGNDGVIWALGLWGNVLPGFVLLLLVRRLAERFEPGFGTAAAVVVGLGTMVLPFSTLLFSHVFTACLAVAAFAVLQSEREGRPSLARVAAAGLLIGLAVLAEYPVAFAGIILGLYAISRPFTRPGESGPAWQAMILRGLLYGAGIVVGLIPLAVYNKWAFGSYTHVAYADIPRQHAGFFGISAPSLRTIAELLLSSRGLLVLSPVLAMGAVGGVLLFRRGRRAEALVIAAVCLVYLLYDSGYYLPFGGGTPGPRFLITTLPFLGVPVALALRRFPGPTLALGAASAVAYVLATAAHPLIGYETEPVVWTRLAGRGNFQPTVLSILGLGHSWGPIAPFVGLILAAVLLAARATPLLWLGRRTLAAGAGVLALWTAYAALGPHAFGIDHAALERTHAAGDANALHKPWGPHPLVTLSLLALGAGLVVLALAARRGRGLAPRERPPLAA